MLKYPLVRSLSRPESIAGRDEGKDNDHAAEGHQPCFMSLPDRSRHSDGTHRQTGDRTNDSIDGVNLACYEVSNRVQVGRFHH